MHSLLCSGPRLACCVLLVNVAAALADDPTATQPAGATQPAATQRAGSQPAEAPKPKLVPISFNNASMNDIAKFLTEQIGKPAIISKDVTSIQVTIVNPKPLPRDQAMYVLMTALNEHGVALEERERTLHLIPISQVASSLIKTIGPEVDCATLTAKNEIVRKIFSVHFYDPAKLLDVLKPLLPSYGHVTADPGTGKLMVVANVERLTIISGIIKQLDMPGVAGGELRVFPIKNVDVYEIVPMLEKLVAGYLGVEVKAIAAAGGPVAPGGPGSGRSGGPDGMSMRGGGPGGDGPGGSAPAVSPGTITVKPEKTPVLIIPDPRQSCIVVAAPPNVLDQIATWLKTLDQKKPPSTQTEIIEAQFNDAGELVQQLNSMLASIPDDSLRNALRIFPFTSSRRIMLVGSEANRELMKKWLKEIDVPDTGTRITRNFDLENADAQQIAENIKELFQDQSGSGGGYYRFYIMESGGRPRTEDRTKVTVTANTRSNSVTVVASPEKMTRIEEQIKEWDKPFSGTDAAPRVFDLRFADPEKTKELLENLFTKKEGPSLPFWWYDEMPQSTASPVGRLFGQFRFEAYPETGKLIVVSKNEENYQVIAGIIAEIDKPQGAGIPRIIQLKFANAETLAEQLNSLLNAPGTPASILRQGTLGESLKEDDDVSRYSVNNNPNNANNRNNQQQQQQQQQTGMMQFWWQNPPSELVRNRQPSNLVGKLRIVPNVEQNLLMVAAPEAYTEAIEEFVQELDKPGQQVLVRAIIAEVTLEDSTSLGYRFSSDPSIFLPGNPAVNENALKGLFTYQFEDVLGGHNTLTFDLPITNVLNLLRRVGDVRIRSEPKVFTADNQRATFFDGQDVPFLISSQNNEISGLVQSFDYKPVGIKLAVRPHITKERKIDLQVNLEVSTLSGKSRFEGEIVDRRETDTRIQLEDGKTFLISGIIKEEERSVVRRVPGLGDIPVLGEIFKHREMVKANVELLIFLTPYVITPESSTDVIEKEPMDRLHQNWPEPEEYGPTAEVPCEEKDKCEKHGKADN